MKISKQAIDKVNHALAKYIFYKVGSNLPVAFKSIQGAKEYSKKFDGVLSDGFSINSVVAIAKDGKFYRSGKKFDQLKQEIEIIDKVEFKINPAIEEVGNFPIDSFEDYEYEGETWKVYSKHGNTNKMLLVRKDGDRYNYTHSNEKLEGEITYKDKVEKKLLINVNGKQVSAVHWYTKFDKIDEEFKTWVLCKINNTTEPYYINQSDIIGYI